MQPMTAWEIVNTAFNQLKAACQKAGLPAPDEEAEDTMEGYGKTGGRVQ